MALPESFYEAVNTGNLMSVRIMMKNSLVLDRTFALFSEMEKEASKMNGLYDIHDGRELITDKSKWDDNYMHLLMVQVTDNFSHERLANLKEVIRYLHPPKEKPQQDTQRTDKKEENPRRPSGSSYQEQKKRDQENGTFLGVGTVVGAGVGAAAGVGIAALSGGSVVAFAIAGAVVGGIVGGIVGNEAGNNDRK